jgi:hypothetical protein
MSSRPFLVTSPDDSEPALGEGGSSRQQSELQPGEIRRPGVQPPTPLMDWGRGDSILWDSHFDGGAPPPEVVPSSKTIHSPTGREPEHISTPLTGYGRGDNLWGVGGSPTEDTKQFPAADPARSQQQQQQYGGGGQHPHFAAFPDQQGGGNQYMGSRQDSGGMGRQDSSFAMQQFRTQSQVLSDELYFQSQWFPPPPPPRVPKESRRSRSELWYYYASKWDITHTQPPPPRCPLAQLEEEFALGLEAQTKVPYRGEYWLDRCNHWFRQLQSNFRPPEPHAPSFVEPTFVMSRCVC